MRANVIYKITCSCEQLYIGETRRNVYTRMAEHAKTSGTNITEICLELIDEFNIDFENVSIGEIDEIENF